MKWKKLGKSILIVTSTCALTVILTLIAKYAGFWGSLLFVTVFLIIVGYFMGPEENDITEEDRIQFFSNKEHDENPNRKESGEGVYD